MNGTIGMKIFKKYMTKAIGAIIAALLTVLLYAVITALPIMWLWNYCLVPAIPYFKLISFVQAFGIKILFSMLFHVTQKTETKK
jgi:hypothetical protein